MANPKLVAVKPQGHDGTKDTSAAGLINGDQHPVSHLAAPVANLNVTAPERTIPDPSLSQLAPIPTNVAITQPRASVTPQTRRS